MPTGNWKYYLQINLDYKGLAIDSIFNEFKSLIENELERKIKEVSDDFVVSKQDNCIKIFFRETDLSIDLSELED